MTNNTYIISIWSIGLILLTFNLMIGLYDTTISQSIFYTIAIFVNGFIFGLCLEYWVSRS